MSKDEIGLIRVEIPLGIWDKIKPRYKRGNIFVSEKLDELPSRAGDRTAEALDLHGFKE